MDFEKSLKELEAIAENMSAGRMGLEESIAAFKKGMDIVWRCRKSLSEAEQVVEKLVKIREDGKPETEPFESSEKAARAKPGETGSRTDKSKAPGAAKPAAEKNEAAAKARDKKTARSGSGKETDSQKSLI